MVKQEIYKINDFLHSCKEEEVIYWNKFGHTLGYTKVKTK